MTNANDIAAAEVKLAEIDPELGKLINTQKPIIREARTDYFSSLSRAIVGQQVSVASAKSVLEKLKSATDLKPDKIVDLSDEDCRALGLSRQKAGYIRDLANHFIEQPDIYNHLDSLSDEEIIEELTEVKGIGVWTAQMFLMFSLLRLDVFAPDDVGVQRGMKQFYGWDNVPAREELVKIAEKWKPYRTIACWHLWESLKNEPA